MRCKNQQHEGINDARAVHAQAVSREFRHPLPKISATVGVRPTRYPVSIGRNTAKHRTDTQPAGRTRISRALRQPRHTLASKVLDRWAFLATLKNQ
jgi:hypothetical protein